jgi:hypothetical protein
MNCKPGDLAIVVSPRAKNAGKIGRCVSRYDGPWLDGEGPGWVLDGTVLYRHDGTRKRINVIMDKWLRPIRDNDGEDEMLRIAGKPREVETL